MVTSNFSKQSPVDLARETFRQLSVSKTPPTPDAYKKLYNEIAGITDKNEHGISAQKHIDELESILHSLATNLALEGNEYADVGRRLTAAAEKRDWTNYIHELHGFTEKLFLHNSAHALPAASSNLTSINTTLPATSTSDANQLILIKDLLTRTLSLALPSLLHTAPELSQESETLSSLLKKALTEKEFSEIGSRLKNLCFKIENVPANFPSPTVKKAEPMLTSLVDDSSVQLVPLVSKLLSQTLSLAVSTLLQSNATLLAISDKLADEVKMAKSIDDFHQIETRLKDLCYKITLKGDDDSEQLQLLLSLFKLLLENVSSLLDDDSWLQGQVVVIQELISGNINYRSLLEAIKNLKEVVYKQSVLKDSITQNKTSVRQLINLFVDRLSVFASTTGNYHEKITIHTKKITSSTSQEDINKILNDLLFDTIHVQTEAEQAHTLMISAQKEVAEAEARIIELEKKLAEMSEQVHEDHLTGSLNRRGFSEILERETARADRRHTSLCLSMLDIDNFKKINDSFGHGAGDNALIHLVNIAKKTLRSMDIVTRYGGEEFAIVMPETSLKEATETMIRVQRELTKHFFMADSERVVITFSAGVAERHPAETQESLIVRADKAMYQAKMAGKNRVIHAE